MWVSSGLDNSVLTTFGGTKYKTVLRIYQSFSNPVLGSDCFD